MNYTCPQCGYYQFGPGITLAGNWMKEHDLCVADNRVIAKTKAEIKSLRRRNIILLIGLVAVSAALLLEAIL